MVDLDKSGRRLAFSSIKADNTYFTSTNGGADYTMADTGVAGVFELAEVGSVSNQELNNENLIIGIVGSASGQVLGTYIKISDDGNKLFCHRTLGYDAGGQILDIETATAIGTTPEVLVDLGVDLSVYNHYVAFNEDFTVISNYELDPSRENYGYIQVHQYNDITDSYSIKGNRIRILQFPTNAVRPEIRSGLYFWDYPNFIDYVEARMVIDKHGNTLVYGAPNMYTGDASGGIFVHKYNHAIADWILFATFDAIGLGNTTTFFGFKVGMSEDSTKIFTVSHHVNESFVVDGSKVPKIFTYTFDTATHEYNPIEPCIVDTVDLSYNDNGTNNLFDVNSNTFHMSRDGTKVYSVIEYSGSTKYTRYVGQSFGSQQIQEATSNEYIITSSSDNAFFYKKGMKSGFNLLTLTYDTADHGTASVNEITTDIPSDGTEGFGHGFVVSEDGTRLLISDIDANNDPDNGVVYIINTLTNSMVCSFSEADTVRSMDNDFSFSDVNDLTNGRKNTYFGHELDITSDGKRVVVASHGRVSIFEISDSGAGTTVHQVGSSITGRSFELHFATLGVSINGDGTIVARLGMLHATTGNGTASVYKYNGSDWVKMGSDISHYSYFHEHPTSNYGNRKMIQLDDLGTTMVIGYPWGESSDQNNGTVKLWKWCVSDWVCVHTIRASELNTISDNSYDKLGWGVQLSSDGLTMTAMSRPGFNRLRIFKPSATPGDIDANNNNNPNRISLTEVQVWIGDENVAINATVSTNSTDTDDNIELLTNGIIFDTSVTYNNTNSPVRGRENEPLYIDITLNKYYSINDIQTIVLFSYNTDAAYHHDRMTNVEVQLMYNGVIKTSIALASDNNYNIYRIDNSNNNTDSITHTATNLNQVNTMLIDSSTSVPVGWTWYDFTGSSSPTTGLIIQESSFDQTTPETIPKLVKYTYKKREFRGIERNKGSLERLGDDKPSLMLQYDDIFYEKTSNDLTVVGDLTFANILDTDISNEFLQHSDISNSPFAVGYNDTAGETFILSQPTSTDNSLDISNVYYFKNGSSNSLLQLSGTDTVQSYHLNGNYLSLFVFGSDQVAELNSVIADKPTINIQLTANNGEQIDFSFSDTEYNSITYSENSNDTDRQPWLESRITISLSGDQLYEKYDISVNKFTDKNLTIASRFSLFDLFINKDNPRDYDNENVGYNTRTAQVSINGIVAILNQNVNVSGILYPMDFNAHNGNFYQTTYQPHGRFITIFTINTYGLIRYETYNFNNDSSATIIESLSNKQVVPLSQFDLGLADLSGTTHINYLRENFVLYNDSGTITKSTDDYRLLQKSNLEIKNVNGPLPTNDEGGIVEGTITMKHELIGGASSIVFQNALRPRTFGTIEYHDSKLSSHSMHLNYGLGDSWYKEQSVFYIGTKSDESNDDTDDTMVIRSGKNLILDASRYTNTIVNTVSTNVRSTVENRVNEDNTVYIQPNGGTVSIGGTLITKGNSINTYNTRASGGSISSGRLNLHSDNHSIFVSIGYTIAYAVPSTGHFHRFYVTGETPNSNNWIAEINGSGINISGGITAKRLRLTAAGSGDDATLSGTAHALQIGLDSNENLRIDNNEIMVVNNGSAAKLNLQLDGGTVDIGRPVSTGWVAKTNLNVYGDCTFGDTSANNTRKQSDNVHKLFGQLQFWGNRIPHTSSDSANSVSDYAKVWFDETTQNAGVFRIDIGDDGNETFVVRNVASSTVEMLIATRDELSAPSFGETSDYRLKDQVQTLSGSYYTVDNIRPVHYILKDSQVPHMGFIAHEVQEHFPTMVSGEKDGKKMQTVKYSQLIPVLVKEIQESKAREKEKNQEIAELKSSIQSLQQEFTRMHQLMRTMEEKLGRFSPR